MIKKKKQGWIVNIIFLINGELMENPRISGLGFDD